MLRTLIVFTVSILVAGGIWISRTHRDGSAVLPSAISPNASRIVAPSVPENVERQPLAGPQASPAMLELLVRSTTRLGTDAPPAPGIDFEVLRMGERSVAVPEVLGYERSFEIGGRLAFGETDAQGLARVALPAEVDVDEHGLPRVLVRVVEPGHQQRTARAYVPRGGDTLQVRILPRTGATARGRVVNAGGSGVLADVRVQRWLQLERGPELRAVERALPLPDGRFELHFDEDLVGVFLTAEAEGVGSAVRESVDLSLSDPPQDLLLTVIGDGGLRGRVVGSDGRGIGGLPLLVRLAEIDLDALYSREPDHSHRRAEGRGRTEVQATTDSEGRFELRGLRREPYVVRAKPGDTDFGYGILLTPQPLLADGSEYRLAVSEPQLVVRVLDEHGTPWSGEPLSLAASSSWSEKPLGWHATPRITVHPATPLGRAPEVTGEALALRSISSHEVACTVASGARYLVAVRGADFHAPARVVEVPPAGGLVEVELRATPPAGWGTVVIRISTDGSGDKYEVALEDPDTGLRLCDVDASRGTVPSVRVPVGRYRVVVEGRASTDFFHGTIMTPRALGRAEAEVEVLTDTTTEVPLEIRAGAKLELLLSGESSDADRDALLREQPVLALPNNAQTLAMYVSSAHVVLQRPQRGPETVHWIRRFEGSSAAGDHLWRAWPLNERHESAPVAPGTWTLVARLPGGREVSSEVVLRSGETTRVRLAFDD